jgi:hypothetical protein
MKGLALVLGGAKGGPKLPSEPKSEPAMPAAKEEEGGSEKELARLASEAIAAGDPAAIQALSDQLGASTDALAAAVAANTWRQGSRQLDVPPLAPLAVDKEGAARRLGAGRSLSRGGKRARCATGRWPPRRLQRSLPPPALLPNLY